MQSYCGARVPLFGKRLAVGMTQHVRVRLEGQLGLNPRSLTMRTKPAVLNGAARSEVNTKGDLGCSSL